MNNHQAFAIAMHERQKVRLLLRAQCGFTAGEQENGVEVEQVPVKSERPVEGRDGLLRNQLRIGADQSVEQPGAKPQPFDSHERVRNGIVLMASGGNVTQGQNQFWRLPYDALRYLVASRYCEIDRLSDFAWQTFGLGPTGYLRVQAVCNFVHNHIRFGYQFARSTKTAYDAFVEQQGVCRDFAHLAITLCRCLGFPARYATGYLGDIGVPVDPSPMDFSAWFEVYLSSGWYTFDARHNTPRIGRIVIARGRDATDVA